MCVCKCMYIYVCIYVYIYMYVCICMYIYVCMYICVCVCVFITPIPCLLLGAGIEAGAFHPDIAPATRAASAEYLYVCVHLCTYMYVCTYIYTYVYTNIYIYIYTYIYHALPCAPGAGIEAGAFHPDIAPATRAAAAEGFNRAEAGVLVCSGLGARGLDFSPVGLVVRDYIYIYIYVYT